MSRYEDFIDGIHPTNLPGEDYRVYVDSPKHYQVFPECEAIEVIARSMTVPQFYGYCFGNVLKYRLRVGKKDNVQKELDKADKYIELFNKYVNLCIKEEE